MFRKRRKPMHYLRALGPIKYSYITMKRNPLPDPPCLHSARGKWRSRSTVMVCVRACVHFVLDSMASLNINITIKSHFLFSFFSS